MGSKMKVMETFSGKLRYTARRFADDFCLVSFKFLSLVGEKLFEYLRVYM